jgi:hypothetical protein
LNKSHLIGALCAVVFAVISMSSNAALVGRDLDGDPTTAEAYYDTVANLTWLANANAGVGSAYDTTYPGTGLMTWTDANAWAASLDIDGTPGPDGWRLPASDTCVSYNCTGSEMGNLFYNVLGGVAVTPIATTHNSNYDLFSNVQSSYYWSSTEYAPNTNFAWYFDTSLGNQNSYNKIYGLYAWAVHDGDVGAVPTTPVDISGTIKTASGADINAMVLASGQYMFSNNPKGVYALSNLPREADGTVKLQVYATGFLPYKNTLVASGTYPVTMTRAGVCPNYNAPGNPSVNPGSAGNWVDISGSVLRQNTQTPVCAMVLANGQYMFSCNANLGIYNLRVPLDTNGQVKLQIYADGYAPYNIRIDEYQLVNDNRLARASECQ